MSKYKKKRKRTTETEIRNPQEKWQQNRAANRNRNRKPKQTTDTNEDGEDDEDRESIEESGNYRLHTPLQTPRLKRSLFIQNLPLVVFQFQICNWNFQVWHKKFLRSFSRHTHTCAPDTHTTTHNLPLGETNVNWIQSPPDAAAPAPARGTNAGPTTKHASSSVLRREPPSLLFSPLPTSLLPCSAPLRYCSSECLLWPCPQ